jgi:hypothetical protein
MLSREGLSCCFVKSRGLDIQLEELVIAEPSAVGTFILMTGS